MRQIKDTPATDRTMILPLDNPESLDGSLTPRVGVSVGVSTGSVVGVSTGSATGSDVGVSRGSATGSGVGVSTGSATGSGPGFARGDAAVPEVGVSTGGATGSGVGVSTGSGVGVSRGGATGSGVGVSTGGATGCGVGAIVSGGVLMQQKASSRLSHSAPLQYKFAASEDSSFSAVGEQVQDVRPWSGQNGLLSQQVVQDSEEHMASLHNLVSLSGLPTNMLSSQVKFEHDPLLSQQVESAAGSSSQSSNSQ